MSVLSKHDRFHTLFEAAPLAMVVVGEDGSIELANRQAEAMLGYGEGELLGQPLDVLLPESIRQGHRAHMEAYFRNPHVRPMGIGMELVALRHDGTEFPCEITLGPLPGEPPGTFAALVDITERRRVDEMRRRSEALEEQNQRFQESNRVKDIFLSTMSHELRTPLNAIIGFSELMYDERAGEVTGEQRQYLGEVLTSAHHLLRIVDDVLDLSKLQSGFMRFRSEPVNVRDVVEEVRDVLNVMTRDRQMCIATEVAVAEVVTDGSRLRQVLYNYLSNAIKFTPDGGQIRVEVRPEGDEYFRLEVTDSGVGIPEADQQRLFMDFQQLDVGHGRRYSGTGLGLAVTRRIVEAQGGEVGVVSTPGHGSVFYAVLPRKLNVAGNGQSEAHE